MYYKKNRIIILFTCYCFLFGILFLFSSGIKKNTQNKSITVLSYNIRHSLGIDSILDLQRIADVINSTNPDIVALQEIDINTKRSGNVHQLEKLAELTNMKFIFGKSMNWDGGEYGNGILTKLNIEDYKTYPLPGEPRCALAATLSLNDTEFIFISTHLDNKKEFREKSIPFINNILDYYKDKPLIFAGDFNATPDSEVFKSLSKKLSNATPNINTVPVDKPNIQIDYIMYSPKQNWEVVSSEVIDEKIASDHRPIKSILELKQKL